MRNIIEGLMIGHWSDHQAKTGCTVVRFPHGSVASGEIRGGAPATREFGLLAPERTVQSIDAVVISGGSAFGLAAADGVVQYLSEHKIGFPTSQGPIPIVVGMSLYDLSEGDASIHPGPKEGRSACLDSEKNKDEFISGQIGAGVGATMGKWLGAENRRPGGIGIVSAELNGVVVCSLFAVNAAGDLAGAATSDAFIAGDLGPWPENSPQSITNTTLGVVTTNLSLTKTECLLLSQSSHDGIARALFPSHTRIDGDAVVAVSTQTLEPDSAKVDLARALAVATTEKAIRQSCI